jgi:TatD DNase family protein
MPVMQLTKFIIRQRGWYCSFAGNLTYPKSELIREAAGIVPDDRLLVETDSPFLAPQPVRGKPNQPANVVATAERLAEIRGVPYGELEEIVEANAARVFGWRAVAPGRRNARRAGSARTSSPTPTSWT